MFDNCELNIQHKNYYLLRIYTNHCCKQLLNVAPCPYYIAIVNYLMFLICRYMYMTFVHINHCKFSIIRYCNLTKFHIPVFLPTYKWNENHQDVQIRCKSVLNNNIYIRLRYLRTMETVKLPRTRFIKVGFLVQQFLRFCRFHVFVDFIKVLCLPLGSVLFLQWFISLVLLLPW